MFTCTAMSRADVCIGAYFNPCVLAHAGITQLVNIKLYNHCLDCLFFFVCFCFFFVFFLQLFLRVLAHSKYNHSNGIG